MYLIRKLNNKSQYLLKIAASSVSAEDVFFSDRETAERFHEYNDALHAVAKIWNKWYIECTIVLLTEDDHG
jgi:hypothetical protein